MKRCFYLVYMIASMFLYASLFYSGFVYADEVYLKNGDRISGKIIEEQGDSVTIKTEAVGSITINKKFVERIITSEEIEKARVKKEKDGLWQRKVSVGYNKSDGNTQNNQLSMHLYAKRKTDYDEFTMKGEVYYSSSNTKMDSQKWYGMGRYAVSFWDRKWYNFYKLETDHDRFANIDYRAIPSAGIGYWLSDEPDWKAMAELAIGFEHTNFRDASKSSNEAVLIPRGFLEKKLIEELRISQDIVLYPSLEDTGKYRLRSETALTNPISDRLSWKISFIDEFNSDPTGLARKNDYRLISSLDYAF